MANVKVKLDSAGVRALLGSDDVEADLRARAERIAAAAGPDHIVDSKSGGNRARASVRTSGFDAALDEATHKTLTSAVNAGR